MTDNSSTEWQELVNTWGSKQGLNSWKKNERVAPEEVGQILVSVAEKVRERTGQKNIAVFSPTSNFPTQEIAALKSADSNIQIIAADNSPIDHKLLQESLSKQDNNQFGFMYADARKPAIKPHSIGVVSDRRGRLWYSAERGRDAFLNVLETFDSLLIPGGCIAIDADSDRIDESEEYSTFDLAKKDLGEDIWSDPEITNNYDIDFIGEGKVKTLLLFKK